MQQDPEVLQVMYQTINFLCSYLQSYDYVKNPKEAETLKLVQNHIFDSSLGRILIDNFTQPISYQDETSLLEEIRLLYFLIRGGNRYI